MPVVAALPSPPRAGDVAFGDARVCIEARQLLLGGVPARLGARALDVLIVLIQRRERVVSKNELLALVWPGLVVEENNLPVHISALRKLLGPRAIATVPGRGYRFTAALDGAPDGPPDVPAAALLVEASTPLYGRDHDLATLAGLVAAHRLVTVAGTGGIGKTSLAQAVARALRPHFADGVRSVDLAPLGDPAHLAATVADALQITLAAGAGAGAGAAAGAVAGAGAVTGTGAVAGAEASAQAQAPSGAAAATAFDAAATSLAEALRSRHLLIVLDNCEHLVQPVAALAATLLHTAPRLHLLATSQEPLKLADEQVYRLGTLGLPAQPTLEAAQHAGAVCLFEARARAADLRFELTGDNVAAVVDICTQLDGIALAIELAAARVPLLGVHGLRDRLGQRLQLLGGGARHAPPRQRTLRAALAWSHALLSPEQQAVFRRLGVMSGRFTLEAAQQVAAAGGIDEWAVLDHLGALVDKSLVVIDGNDTDGPDNTGEVRCRLLETMRHFALERLAEAAEERATRERHLAFFVARAEQAKAHLTGPLQAAWVARLDGDRDNLLAAHAWCDHAERGAEQGLRLATALLRYWASRSLVVQGHRICAEALARPGSAAVAARLRCEALNAAGYFGLNLAQEHQAVVWLRDSVATARHEGLADLLVRALARLGLALKNLGDLPGARACNEEALARARQLGDQPALVGLACTSLAELERLQGHTQAALPLCEEALALARAAGDRLVTLITLGNLAMVLTVADAPARARPALVEMLCIADELDARRGRLTVLECAAGLAAHAGQCALAVRFESAADTLIAQAGGVRDVTDAAFLAPLLERARAALGHADSAHAQAAGRALTYAEVMVELRLWLADAA